MVPVPSQQPLAAIRLRGVVDGPVTRCIRFFPLDYAACGTPIDVDVLFSGSPAMGAVTFEVEDGDWTMLNAKDEQHVISATGGLTLIGSTYYADVALELLGGDTDNDDLVDMSDVSWLMATFGEFADGGSHPWDGSRCADFSDNGFVGSEDYTFLAENWLAQGDFECGSGESEPSGGHALPGSGTAIPLVKQVRTVLPVSGLDTWVADRVDLNRDGVVDVQDVKDFERLHGLGNALSAKIEATTKAAPKPVKTANR